MWTFTVSLTVFPYLLPGWATWLAEPCPDPSISPTPSPVEEAVCQIPALGKAVQSLPARLWHLLVELVTEYRWWLAAAVAAAVALTVAVRWLKSWLWRRAVDEGEWVRLTPPRTLPADSSGRTWRLMSALAVQAGTGWWPPARPPITFEIYARQGRLMIGMWRPKRVTLSALAAKVDKAWPGTVVEPQPAPRIGGPWRWAGMWLAPAEPDTGMLVDEQVLKAGRSRTGTRDFEGDPLWSVLSALRAADDPAVLQILVRTVTPHRLAQLRAATRRPAKPHRHPALVAAGLLGRALRGLLRGVLDMVTPGPSIPPPHHRAGQKAPPGLVETAAMRDATTKYRARSLLLAAIRVAAGSSDTATARYVAWDAATSYALASTALKPIRLPRAARAVELRTARRVEWVLFTVDELGVLAHVPADPAAYGITTTARHRTHPPGTSQPPPEPEVGGMPGWLSDGWSPSTDPNTNNGSRPADTSDEPATESTDTSPAGGDPDTRFDFAEDEAEGFWDDEDGDSWGDDENLEYL